MKKKLISILLCGAMIGTMLTACGNEGTSENNGSSQPSEVEDSSVADNSEADNSGDQSEAADPVEVAPEALPEAHAHYTFDGDDEGYTVVVQANKADDSINDGGAYDIVASDIVPVYADGAVG